MIVVSHWSKLALKNMASLLVEDLMAWKFAQAAANYWRQKTEELKRVAGADEAIC